MLTAPKKPRKKKAADPTAALRQQRRRQRLKRVEVLLTDERVSKLNTLLEAAMCPTSRRYSPRGWGMPVRSNSNRNGRMCAL